MSLLASWTAARLPAVRRARAACSRARRHAKLEERCVVDVEAIAISCERRRVAGRHRVIVCLDDRFLPR